MTYSASLQSLLYTPLVFFLTSINKTPQDSEAFWRRSCTEAFERHLGDGSGPGVSNQDHLCQGFLSMCPLAHLYTSVVMWIVFFVEMTLLVEVLVVVGFCWMLFVVVVVVVVVGCWLLVVCCLLLFVVCCLLFVVVCCLLFVVVAVGAGIYNMFQWTVVN